MYIFGVNRISSGPTENINLSILIEPLDRMHLPTWMVSTLNSQRTHKSISRSTSSIIKTTATKTVAVLYNIGLKTEKRNLCTKLAIIYYLLTLFHSINFVPFIWILESRGGINSWPPIFLEWRCYYGCFCRSWNQYTNT